MPILHTAGPFDVAANETNATGEVSLIEQEVAKLKAAGLRDFLLTFMACLASCIALLITCLWLYRRHHRPVVAKEEGLLVSSAFPKWLRYCISLLTVCFTIVPFVVTLVTFVFAELYHQAEGWTRLVAFEYAFTTAASLTVPLTTVSPTTFRGDILDVAIGLLQFVTMSLVTGLVASMALITMSASKMSGTWCGLLRYSFIYVPLVMTGLFFAFGRLISSVEGWKGRDGFLYMASCILGPPNPLTEVIPATRMGKLLEMLSIVSSIGLSGALVGIVGMHPKIEQVLRVLEGAPNFDDDSGAEKPDDSAEKGLAVLGSCCVFEDPEADAEETPLRQIYKGEPQFVSMRIDSPLGGGRPLVAQYASLRCKELAMLVQQESQELRRVETMAAQHRWRLNHLWMELQAAADEEHDGMAGVTPTQPSLPLLDVYQSGVRDSDAGSGWW